MKKCFFLACLCTSLYSCRSDAPRNQNDMLASSTQLLVPFSSQAPFANWDEPYQEACEEMSLLMVHHFLTGTTLSPETADKELLELITWEHQQGYAEDVTVITLGKIAEEYFGYKATIIESPTVYDIKSAVIQGNPVILPAAGRMLRNKYYSGEGPWYHMLVVTGYTPSTFITNDPGTRRGKNFSYKRALLMNAIHDWSGIKENIETGTPRMLILEKPPII